MENPTTLTRDEAPLTPATAPFHEAPCACVKRHTPKSEITEAHHVWPQYDQLRKYGELREPETVDLCPTSHRSIHRSIDKQLRGERYRLPNPYLREMVDYALEKIRGEA